MKVRTKLLLTISSLPILIILIIVSGLFQTSYIENSTEQIKSDFETSVLAGQIRADLKDQGMIIRNLMIFENEASTKIEMSKLQNERENIQYNVFKLEDNVSTPEQEELVEQLKQTIKNYENYLDSVVSFVNENNKESAKDLMEKNADKMHQEITVVLRNITNGFNDQLEASMVSLITNVKGDIIFFCTLIGVVTLAIIFIFIQSISPIFKRMSSMSNIMGAIANKKLTLNTKVEVLGNNEFDEIAKSFNLMTESLEMQLIKEKDLTWKTSNINDITTSLTSKHNLQCLGDTLLSKLVPLVECSHAIIYVKDIERSNNQLFKYTSSYAFNENHVKPFISSGEGLIGQAIKEKKLLHIEEIPSNYMRISSGLGESIPNNLLIVPIIFENEVNAVIEIASFKECNQKQIDFLEELSSNLGIVLESVLGRIQLSRLLEESQTLMEEVQAQSEELQNQQEELRATNEELEEQTQALRQSEQKLQLQQEELEQTNADLEEKAKRLEEQNIKYEEANRIVEKAKAELEVKAEQLALSSKYKSEFLANMSHELRTPLNSLIILSKLLADNPGKNLSRKQVEYAKTIYSSGNDLLVLINDILDLAKIESGKSEIILGEINISEVSEFVLNYFKAIAESKNLNFNMQIKEGTPSHIYNDEVRIQQVLKNLLANAFKFTDKGEVNLEIYLDQKRTEIKGKSILAFSVIDTGIGISKDKLDYIFEAFQQADGTTSRKYGGTGLGLSISRELASLLGGEIEVESVEGKGSKFTFYVGNYEEKQNEENSFINEAAITLVEPIEIEGSKSESKIVKKQENNSHIKRLLIVDDDLNQRNSLMELIGNMDFVIKAVSTGKEAIDLLKLDHFDCLILDLGLTDTTGFNLLTEIKNNEAHQDLKVFVYTGRDLSSKEEIELNKLAHTIIIKNEHSPERLVAELQLYLTESLNSTESENISLLEKIKSSRDLIGKKILLVDDDVRNVFALSSVLEMAGVEVIFAENGIESLNMLEEHSDVDLILMDIMMPEMDGYEAITRIRSNNSYQHLPIIALTAKAMKEDREKCLAIGASDYVAKPVEPEQLLSIIKVWLY